MKNFLSGACLGAFVLAVHGPWYAVILLVLGVALLDDTARAKP